MEWERAVNRNYHVAFSLGVKAAEIVYGVNRNGKEMEVTDSLWKLVQQIAEGDVTLLDTPEESLAAMPPLPAELAAVPGFKEEMQKSLKDALQNLPEARRAERQMAQIIMDEWATLGLKRIK